MGHTLYHGHETGRDNQVPPADVGQRSQAAAIWRRGQQRVPAQDNVDPALLGAAKCHLLEDYMIVPIARRRANASLKLLHSIKLSPKSKPCWWWPAFYDYIHRCHSCISRQKPDLKDAPYHPLKQVYEPRQVVYLDLLGPISGINSESKFVFLSIRPIKLKKATTVAKAIMTKKPQTSCIHKGLSQIVGPNHIQRSTSRLCAVWHYCRIYTSG